MLRITQLDDAEAGPTIKLEGKLFGPWLEEVVRVVTANTASAELLRLDLSAVSNVDPAGIAMLRSLMARHVILVGCSRYIARLLDPDGTRTYT